MKGTHGFTLLEMIVSMVIVSVIVLAVYTAYSTVTRTWSASQEQTARFRLEAVSTRLLVEDWKALRSYTFSTERGVYPFLFRNADQLAYVNEIWQKVKAVKEDKIYDLDSNLYTVSRNIKMMQTIENLKEIIYGETEN